VLAYLPWRRSDPPNGVALRCAAPLVRLSDGETPVPERVLAEEGFLATLCTVHTSVAVGTDGCGQKVPSLMI
jgi:hypothetical protein